MDGYVTKPIDPPTLFGIVEEGLGPMSFDEGALLRRLSDDADLMTEAIRLFLDDLPVRLAEVSAALAAADASALRDAAHALKGAAATLSADRLTAAAHTLEQAGAESRFDAADANWERLSAEAEIVADLLRRRQALHGTPP